MRCNAHAQITLEVQAHGPPVHAAAAFTTTRSHTTRLQTCSTGVAILCTALPTRPGTRRVCATKDTTAASPLWRARHRAGQAAVSVRVTRVCACCHCVGVRAFTLRLIESCVCVQRARRNVRASVCSNRPPPHLRAPATRTSFVGLPCHFVCTHVLFVFPISGSVSQRHPFRRPRRLHLRRRNEVSMECWVTNV